MYFGIEFRIRAGEYSDFVVFIDLANVCCAFCFALCSCGLSALYCFLLGEIHTLQVDQLFGS